MKHFITSILSIITLSSCSGLFTSTPSLQSGNYILNLKVDSILNPIRIEITQDHELVKLVVKNDTEEIQAEKILIKDDSIFFNLPVFNSEFKGKITSINTFEGNWYNYHKGPDYIIPFKAYKVDKKTTTLKKTSLGNWEVIFSKGTEDESKAIGSFNLQDSIITGTFKTETGDYRFLEGIKTGNNFYLSCFDGSHAFYFTGTFSDDSTISNGTYRSGKHWSEKWEAIRNDTFKLRDSYSLTYLNPGYDRFTFSFPDLNKKQVSLDDDEFKNKVVIVQLMGSWCPNCLDESKYFKDLYNRKKSDGLEIIALSYEAKPDFDYARERVSKLKTSLKSNYTFLIAGTSNKEDASKTLPMLNKIMSFPTTIILDKQHHIRSIYTGFNGPSTGQAYLDYKQETESLIDSLLHN